MTVNKKKGKSIIKGNYCLIKGDFAPEDALEIINDLILKKINFHEVRNFSQRIRFGSEDPHSINRINYLIKCKESVKELAKEAKMNDQLFQIKSNIKVSLIKKKAKALRQN